MSLRVAVACEDHTHDQYVVKPVVEMLLGATGFQRAHVRVITDPRINGIEDLKANACAKTVVVAARQELEVWALWGSRDEVGVPWREIRAELHPKEVFFDPLVTKSDLRAPGKGRARLIKKSLETGWSSLKQGCDELGVLQTELTEILQDRD